MHKAARVLFCAFVPVALACSDVRKVVGASSEASECTRCHGGQLDQTGAPPVGLASDAIVGAHHSHVVQGAVAGAFDCSECHVKPGAANAESHASRPVVQFATAPGSLANAQGASPQWDSSAEGGPSCSATYCHGAFRFDASIAGNPLSIVGNVENAPVWTRVDGTQARCGTCHGDPDRADQPPSLPRGHFGLATGSTNATCAVCHAASVDASGAIVPGGGHLDGAVEVDPAALHPDGWMTIGGPHFHGAIAQPGSAPCLRCHSVDLPARVTTFACATCHGVGFVPP